MKPRVRALLLFSIGLLLLPALLAACPLCKEAISDADAAGGSASLGRGFYYSILLMMSAPFLLAGGVALRIYLFRRRRGVPL